MAKRWPTLSEISTLSPRMGLPLVFGDVGGERVKIRAIVEAKLHGLSIVLAALDGRVLSVPFVWSGVSDPVALVEVHLVTFLTCSPMALSIAALKAFETLPSI
jgi:hypothetical protein